MSKVDYITKDFMEEFNFFYATKKKYFERKLASVAKKHKNLSFRISECGRLGLTPVYVFPNVGGCSLGIVWQFPYLLNISGNNGYREFTIRYNCDIDVAVDYFLKNDFPEDRNWEENLYVVDGEVYDKDRFDEFCHSFKAYLTNFYVMDNVYGDIARRLVNDKKLSYEGSNDWDKVVAFLNRIYKKDEREYIITMTRKMWDMYR